MRLLSLALKWTLVHTVLGPQPVNPWTQNREEGDLDVEKLMGRYSRKLEDSARFVRMKPVPRVPLHDAVDERVKGIAQGSRTERSWGTFTEMRVT